MFSVSGPILHLSIYIYEMSIGAHIYHQESDYSQERNDRDTEFWCWYV